MGMEFYIFNHVLYLIISPSADKGFGGALKAKMNQRQPLWRAAMIPSHSHGQQLGRHSHQAKGEGGHAGCCGPCLAVSAELHPLEALLSEWALFLQFASCLNTLLHILCP